MKLVSNKSKGHSIKDKKNSIINKQEPAIFYTPVKTDRKAQLLQESVGIHRTEKQSCENIITTAKENKFIEQVSMTEPKNAFMKKIFQKKRQIVPIRQLIETFSRRNTCNNSSVDKSEAEENKSQSKYSIRSAYISRCRKKQTQPDRSTKDEAELSQKKSSIKHRTGLSEASRSLSQSKRIKYSIIHNDAHC